MRLGSSRLCSSPGSMLRETIARLGLGRFARLLLAALMASRSTEAERGLPESRLTPFSRSASLVVNGTTVTAAWPNSMREIGASGLTE